MSPPDLKDLERLAEFEIKRLDDTQRRTGITPWLLYAALGALAWRILESATKIQDWLGIFVLWACLVLVIDSLRGIWSTVSFGVGGPSITPRFFRSGWLLSGWTLQILIKSAIPLVAAAIVWWGAVPTGWTRWAWAVIGVTAIFGALSGLVICFFEFFIPASVAAVSKGFRGGMVLRSIVELPTIYVVWLLGWPILHAQIVQPEAQVALILTVITMLLEPLAGYDAFDPIRATFEDIRRGIGLGELTYEQAKARLEIATRGHSASALIEERLTAFLRHIATVGEAQRAMEAALAKLTEAGLETPVLVAKELQDNLATARKALGRATQIDVSLTVRAQLLMMMDERVKVELTKVLASVAKQLEAANKKQKELAERCGALRRRPPNDGQVI